MQVEDNTKKFNENDELERALARLEVSKDGSESSTRKSSPSQTASPSHETAEQQDGTKKDGDEDTDANHAAIESFKFLTNNEGDADSANNDSTTASAKKRKPEGIMDRTWAPTDSTPPSNFTTFHANASPASPTNGISSSAPSSAPSSIRSARPGDIQNNPFSGGEHQIFFSEVSQHRMMSYILLSQAVIERDLASRIRVGAPTGKTVDVFLGQLSHTYASRQVQYLVNQICGGEVVTKIKEGPNHNCCFVTLLEGAADALLAMNKRVLCDVDRVWIATNDADAQFLREAAGRAAPSRPKGLGIPKSVMVVERARGPAPRPPSYNNRTNNNNHNNNQNNNGTGSNPNSQPSSFNNRMAQPQQQQIMDFTQQPMMYQASGEQGSMSFSVSPGSSANNRMPRAQPQPQPQPQYVAFVGAQPAAFVPMNAAIPQVPSPPPVAPAQQPQQQQQPAPTKSDSPTANAPSAGSAATASNNANSQPAAGAGPALCGMCEVAYQRTLVTDETAVCLFCQQPVLLRSLALKCPQCGDYVCRKCMPNLM